MGLSQRNGALLLVFVAAVCMEFYQAQHVVGIRCKCPSFSKILRSNFTDFQVTEARAGCDRVELTVTRIKLDNSTETLCMYPKRKLGLQILSCWERINKDKSRKTECLNKQRRLEDRASED
uniref:Chemokine interleukin-8-like domain-containing protein n=1 Tax=Poecilia reticulata TaxID=8081 RepID=A0A3P9N550_POERE